MLFWNSDFLLSNGRNVWPRSAYLLLNELKVLAKDFLGETLDVHSFSHCLVHFACRLLHLFVLADDVLLQLVHLGLVALDGRKLIVRFSDLNAVEDFQYVVVLVLHVLQP